jgi:hypothetical protein
MRAKVLCASSAVRSRLPEVALRRPARVYVTFLRIGYGRPAQAIHCLPSTPFIWVPNEATEWQIPIGKPSQ